MSAAIPLLPEAIRPFFVAYQATIVEHAIDPDLWRTAGWEEESPRHFLDMDAYGPAPFTDLPRDFDEAVKKYGRDMLVKNGLLPWRTQEIHTKLVEAFMQKAPYSRDNIKFFSSVIGHYLGDAQVPFHAALNHDGQLTGQWGIHARFETELFERYKDKLQVTPGPLVPVTNARDVTFDSLVKSYSYVQTILDADRAAIGDRAMYDDQYFAALFAKVKPILEDRLARSITIVASAITSAWEQADKPALPLDQPRTPRPVRRRENSPLLRSSVLVFSVLSFLMSEPFLDEPFDRREDQQDDQRDAGRDEGQVIATATRSHTNRGVHPNRRRRRQALDAGVRPHDGAGAKKSNTGHDL
jgi:hypothetical protein